MKKRLLTVVCCVLAGSFAASAETFDQSLVSPAAGGVPAGWFNGSGNPNGGFTVDDESGIEIGLRAKLRQSPNVIDNPTGDVYAVPTGSQTNPANPARAAWNYEWAIDLTPLGVGSLTLGDVTAFLTVTDEKYGVSATVNPLTYWADNSVFGGVASQNSENPVFGDFPLAALYNENNDDTFDFTLVVKDNAGATLASDSMQVVVGAGVPTPEPSTFGLIGLGLGAFGLVARKRRKS